MGQAPVNYQAAAAAFFTVCAQFRPRNARAKGDAVTTHAVALIKITA